MARRGLPIAGTLRFDFDAEQIGNLITELGMTERQAKYALSRALRRTAGTLRRMSERGLKSKLDVRKTTYLRRRLKFSRFSRASFEGARLWFGANDMPVSALRGKVKETSGGASFSGKAGQHTFDDGFVAKSRRKWTGGRRTILVRKGKKRLPIREAELPVKDEMDVFIEDEVFDQVNEIFWKHFERDMLARAQFGVGQRG